MPKRFSFSGGIVIPLNKKQTEQLPVELLQPPSRVIIPLLQHSGTTAHPLVKRGDPVSIGQLIGEPSENDSLAVHSSVSGEVQSIGLFPHPDGREVLSVEIENNFKDDKANNLPFDHPWQEAAPGQLIQKIQAMGLAGMSGDGTPTHLKLSPPSKKTINTVILNAIECEPYLTTDTRLMIEKTEELLTGLLIVKKITGASKAVAAIDCKMLSVNQAISSWLSDQRFKDIIVSTARTKYPQGSERQLIEAVTKKQIPSGGCAADTECLVFSASTILAVHDAIICGAPLYQRVISVCGPTIRNPKNLLVRIGTPIGYVLDNCGIDAAATKKVIMGGPMTGMAQTDLCVPVIKTTSGLFAFNESTPALQEFPCIRCGECVRVCPSKLVPSKIVDNIKKNRIAKAMEWNLTDCIECGACAYICPAKINIVHYIKLGKYNLQLAKKTESSKVTASSRGSIKK